MFKKIKSTIKWCVGIISVSFVAYILLFTRAGAEGAMLGMKTAITSVVPSLFPFMVLSTLVMNTKMSEFLGKITSPVAKYIFRCDKNYGGLILFSMVGGYPIGAKLLGDMLYKEEIDKETASKLLCFTVNPGPAFTVAVVGAVFLGNVSAGWILFFSQLIAVFITALVFSKGDNRKTIHIKKHYKSLPFAFANAVTSSGIGIINITAFISVFSAFAQVLAQGEILYTISKYISTVIPFSWCDSNTVLCFLKGILEVTTGCATSDTLNRGIVLPLLSFMVAFGGISVICQIYGMFSTEINMLPFIISRFYIGCFSTLITLLLEKIFPSAALVYSMSSPPTMYYDSSTAILSLCMLTMSFMVLLSLSLHLNRSKI